MAISKKGSRKIVVEDTEFRWSATGNDGYITVVIWPVDKDNIKLTGSFQYHDQYINQDDERGTYLKTKGQIIITNRIIRQILIQVGFDKIFNSKGQIDLGHLGNFYDINNALRVPID